MLNNFLPNLDPEKKELLQNFIQEILAWNQKVNLLSVKDEKELIIKHILDSISVLDYLDFPENWQVLDIGTGGGFPCMILAILKPKINFTLLDSTTKKINVLKTISQKIGIKNVSFALGRAEELAQNPTYREKFDLVTGRAVAFLPTLLELAIGFIKKDGLFAAYKGPNYEQEIKESKIAGEILKIKLQEKYLYSLPEEMGKRVLLVYRKIGETSKKYPRKTGIPNKKPLGTTNN